VLTGSTRPRGAGIPADLRRAIAAYYDSTQVLYSLLWSPTGVHYGIWEYETRSHAEAIRNSDRRVAAHLALPPGSLVLDAGCGIGGTSCHLAEDAGLRVVGLTLSRVQARRARRRAARRGSTPPPAFLIGDYACGCFADETFAGVLAVESSCYAEPKSAFVGEAFRVLRRGGRLVVLDGFLSRAPATADASSLYRELCDGLALRSLATVAEFDAALRQAGFAAIACEDLTVEVLPSAHRIATLSRIGVRVCRGLRLPHRWELHGRAGLAQLPLMRSGLMTYRLFSARKP
jgi:cyclopropane fatty-acyl-phospholipid synthase-like methyltransferase